MVRAQAEDSHGLNHRPIFNWTVSAGTISYGQGTLAIGIDTSAHEGWVTVTMNREFIEAYIPFAQKNASCKFYVKPQEIARLVDEYKTAGSNCEETFARLDTFIVELNNDPSATGTIFIYDDPKSAASAHRRTSQVRNHIRLRHFDPSRISIVAGPVRKDASVQFWLVPTGAEPPELLPSNATRLEPKARSEIKKPYLYARETSDGIPGCDGNLFDLDAFANELRSDKTSRGKIVIGETSSIKFRSKRAEILGSLRRSGFSTRRITFVFKKVRRNALAEFVELWIG